MKAMNNMRFTLVAAVAALMAFSSLAQDVAAKNAAPAPTKAADKKDAKGDKSYMPIAEARAKIGEIISEPVKMTETMKKLSPEDQKSFVADVNAAISKLPGSVEDKTAKYLNVNKAALKGASSGNMANVLAVTFASVPPESLTVISERYANDLFNRDADPSHKMSDAAFEKTAAEVVGKVVQATTGSDDAGVRNTLAILMFVRASNDSIDGLSDRLVETIPDTTTRELAKKEWIPAAMAKEEGSSYDAMLAFADAGKNPNIELVITLAGPQILDALLVDMTSGMDNNQGVQTTPIVDQAFGGFDESRVNAAELTDTKSTQASANGGNAVPRTTNPLVPWNPEYQRGDVQVTPETIILVKESVIEEQSNPTPTPEPEPEPKPYPYTDL